MKILLVVCAAFFLLLFLQDTLKEQSLFTLQGKLFTLFDLALALTILSGGLWLAGIYKRFIMHDTRIKTKESTRMLLAGFGRYSIIFITFLVVLNIIGIQLTSLTVVAGALSLGLGFGLQNVINNFASGIILIAEKTIRIGDTIQVNDALKGTVTDIRLRSTILRTFDNIEVIIPNSELAQNKVINWTWTDAIRRLKIPFSVAYGSDFDGVKEVLLNALQESTLNYYEDEKKKANVWMTQMGASSLDLELIVFIKTDDPDRPAPSISDFLVMIYKALNNAGISIPFPQMDLHVIDTPAQKVEKV